jgi:hypothetical protein
MLGKLNGVFERIVRLESFSEWVHVVESPPWSFCVDWMDCPNSLFSTSVNSSTLYLLDSESFY